jgi:hypothetical protein
LVNNLTKLLDQYGLKNKIITYVKNEGSNLNTMTIALKFVMKCDESFETICFRHFPPKECQFVITNDFFCRNLKYVLIKFRKSDLQKCVIWPKKSRMGIQEWNKACLDSNVPLRKLNT